MDVKLRIVFITTNMPDPDDFADKFKCDINNLQT